MGHIGSLYQSSAADANDKHPVEWTNERTQRLLQEHLSALRESLPERVAVNPVGLILIILLFGFDLTR